MKILGNWGLRSEEQSLESKDAYGPGSDRAITEPTDNERYAHILRDRLKTKDSSGAISDASHSNSHPDGLSVPSSSETQPTSIDNPARNAWDLQSEETPDQYIGQSSPEDEGSGTRVGASAPTEPATLTRPSESQASGTRTRLIGFDKSDGTSVDVFEQEPAVTSVSSLYPVGWVVVIEGPGRGHAFTLHSGLSQIGRSDDQAIALNFGDTAISRSNHAAIVFDNETNTFMMGHGGKANIVRLNGKPIIANEEVKDGDIIKIGETALQLKTFCGNNFSWVEGHEYESEPDVLSIV